MSINLLDFCDPETSRYAIDKPWRDGDVVRATDGRIAIEVDASLYPVVDKPDGRVPRFDDVFGPFRRVDEWSAMPSILSCDKCDSTGEITGQCEFCKGAGRCVCGCGDDHDCGNCGGSGEEYLNDCRDCQPIICGRRIRRYYAAKMAKLPEIVVGGAIDGPEEMLFFKFTGGRGAVCPIRNEG